MKVYTISSGDVATGARVARRALSSGMEIPVIMVGEEGRGRKLDFVVVELLPENKKRFDAKEEVSIEFAVIGTTRNGGVKLIEKREGEADEFVAVFYTQMGYRGGNSHTGDRTPETFNSESNIQFLSFPGRELASGTIAEGQAGGMGSGKQIIAVMPKGVVFRTGYSGRMYGRPTAHYYIHNESDLISSTWDDRIASDIF